MGFFVVVWCWILCVCVWFWIVLCVGGIFVCGVVFWFVGVFFTKYRVGKTDIDFRCLHVPLMLSFSELFDLLPASL